VQRLDVITTRFSNIGSIPVLKEEDVAETIETFMSYLQKRISTKVSFSFVNELAPNTTIKLNKYLFEWVIENICKNAVDAMEGVGALKVVMKETKNNQIAIDISDTGKGIAKKNVSKVFNPGFSTKKRGWGLGLTLAKRIIENYHDGKLLVKSSEVNKGTTFRILLGGKV
jgi:signal transduction histidine kinase